MKERSKQPMQPASPKKGFTDNRGRRIVYISCCLLNQNAHAPGIATRKGAFTELIRILLDNEIGIEQLPCMECRLWGGVARKRIFRMQPLVFNSVGKAWFPVIEFFSNMEMKKTGHACRKEAENAVDRMVDYVTEGYAIIAVIGVNGSPTCGVTQTIDYMEIVKNKEALGLSLEELMHPRLEKVIDLERRVRIPGSGFFFRPLKEELEKRNLDTKVIGCDLLNEPQKEAGRIAGLLDLQR